MSSIQQLKTLAESCKGWDNLDKCSKSEGSDEDWSVGACDEDGNFFPVMTIDTDQYDQSGDSVKLAQYYAAANPSAVLELIAEIERWRKLFAWTDDGANKVTISFAPLCAHMDERDQLKAENEALRKDAERYRWLRQDDVVQYEISTKCSEEKMDAAIDAAMSKEASHD
jgi:hypothetical protein